MATLADYGPEVRAEVKQVREVVATLHEQLIKWNLVVWTAGNVSQRLHTADLMVIKPSGLRYEYLTPSSMVVCDLDGNVVDGAEAQLVHDGDRARTHGDDVADDAAHAGGRALVGFDE